MSIFVTFSNFFVISLGNTYRIQKKSIVKYFQTESSLAHFTPTLELSANLIQVIPFCFKLKFLMKKVMELRS